MNEGIDLSKLTASRIREGLVGALTDQERAEHLQSVRHESGSTVRVFFADGRAGLVDLAIDLGINTSQLRMMSARVDQYGAAAEIDHRDGSVYDIDSSVLRAAVDPAYADELSRAIDGAIGV